MKKLFRLLFLLLFAGFLSMSFTGKKIIHGGNPHAKIHYDSIPESYFISDSFFERYEMQLYAGDNKNMRVWVNPAKDALYGKLNDIRIGFKNKKEALKFFKKNLEENSEKALEIQTKISIPGTSELHIFKESDAMVKADKLLNVNVHYYFFLFLVENVYVKVFVSGRSDTTVSDASAFAVEASKCVKKNLLK